MELHEPRGRGILIISLFVALLIGGTVVWRELESRPISSVRIAGEFVNVSRESLQRVVNQFLPSGILRLNVEAVRRAAAEMPWVRRVSVRRIWPDSLHVAVVERVAVARWNDDAYLEADG
ncbi:MAG TPA: FtsQ-type POTRA domain-containing protein, partial [Gammaproteobacteria bacterium]